MSASASTIAPPSPVVRSLRHHTWDDGVARWVGRVVVAAGVWCLLAIPLEYVAPTAVRVVGTLFGLVNLPVAANVFTGVMFLVVGSALVVRKRAALWFTALGFQAGWLVVAALVTVLKAWRIGHAPKVLLDTPLEVGVFWVEVLTAVALLWLLWRIRGSFTARVAPGSLRRALLNLAAGLAASAAVGIVLTELFPGTLDDRFREVMWALRTAIGSMPDPDSPFYGGTGERWVAAVIGALSTIALLHAGHVLLRSARSARHLEVADEVRVRRLLARWGDGDSLGYFATRRDKAVLFSPDERAAITYRVEAGASLASGDPVGDPSSWPAAIGTWLEEARAFGWSPAVLSASEQGAAAYRRAGFRVLTMGDEAVLDVDDFHLGRPSMGPLRQAVTRVERSGHRVEIRHHGEVGEAEMAELAAAAERWRGDEPERGFSMALGRLGDAADRRCVVVTARDADGVLRGLLSFVPWGRSGLSLDVMRRDPAADNGVVEMMVCATVEEARRWGTRRISLNFAMFREVFASSERLGAGPVVRLTATLLSAASRWWQIETLYRANAKYQPRWQPRYLCFADTLQLNRALIAAGITEGQLPVIAGRVDDPGQAPASPELVAAIDALELERSPSLERPRDPAEQARVRKLDALRGAGLCAFPATVDRTQSIADVRRLADGLGAGERSGHTVAVAGRLVRSRRFGRLCFGVLLEGDDELQVMLTADRTEAEGYQRWLDLVDVGDEVSCSGEVIATRTGELTVEVRTWAMAAKALRPLPAPQVPGTREGSCGQSELDVIVDAEVREELRRRSRLLTSLRSELVAGGFVEVETPVLHAVASGDGHPFVTHYRPLDQELYLRRSPEPFLKRLRVAGLDRVFELGRAFVNEGDGGAPRPERTVLELYAAHHDHVAMRELGRLLAIAAMHARDGRDGDGGVPPTCAGRALDGPWPVVGVHDAVSAATGTTLRPSTDRSTLRGLCADHGISEGFDATAGELVQRLFEALVIPGTVAPTFFTDVPLDAAPTAHACSGAPELAERTDLVVHGRRIGIAQSELTDPLEQRLRLVDRARRRGPGPLPELAVDEAFLRSLEHAMAPTGGLRLDVDALSVALADPAAPPAVLGPFPPSIGSPSGGRRDAY